MARALVAAWVLALLGGCATAGGSSVMGDAGATDTPAEGGDALFPLDDASDDAHADTVVPDGGVSDTGGVVDTGSPDTGPACGAVGQPCCAGACGADGYCYASKCVGKPKLIFSSPDGSYGGADCADLSKAHLAPSYFEKVVITGRPTAISYRYYRKTSCGETVGKLVPDGAQPLDGTGVYVYTIENATGDTSCTNGNLGIYESWAVVDGVESAHAFGRIFSSGCATYATCATVGAACPP